jgi:uncharacterized membrane protein YidH (DUF202 family)
LSDRSDGANRNGNVTDYLANERTYLTWLRTGIATIGLGFVVAKFGIAIRELTGISALPRQMDCPNYHGGPYILNARVREVIAI